MDKIEKIFDKNKKLSNNIEFVYDIEGSEGEYVDFPDTISDKLKNGLHNHGIQQLYSHQAKAWELSQENKNFCVLV